MAKSAGEGDRFEDIVLDGLPNDLLILGKYMKIMPPDKQITTSMDEAIMNHVYTEFVGREEISDLLHQQEIGASLISFYMK